MSTLACSRRSLSRSIVSRADAREGSGARSDVSGGWSACSDRVLGIRARLASTKVPLGVSTGKAGMNSYRPRKSCVADREGAECRPAPRRPVPQAPRPGLRAPAARWCFRAKEGHSPAPSRSIPRTLRTDSLGARLGLAPTRGRPVRVQSYDEMIAGRRLAEPRSASTAQHDDRRGDSRAHREVKEKPGMRTSRCASSCTTMYSSTSA
jgi:hypothetical protein